MALKSQQGDLVKVDREESRSGGSHWTVLKGWGRENDRASL